MLPTSSKREAQHLGALDEAHTLDRRRVIAAMPARIGLAGSAIKPRRW
jgi:hypothetical protein